MRPFNLLIIDGLNFFDLEDKKLIYKSLAKKMSDYKILIFDIDDPIAINNECVKIQIIRRNRLMRKLEKIQSFSKKNSLDRFIFP